MWLYNDFFCKYIKKMILITITVQVHTSKTEKNNNKTFCMFCKVNCPCINLSIHHLPHDLITQGRLSIEIGKINLFKG